MDFSSFKQESEIFKKSIIFPPYLLFYRSLSQKIAAEVIQEDGSLDLAKIKLIIIEICKLDTWLQLEEHKNHIVSILNKLLVDKFFQKKLVNFDLPIASDFQKNILLSTGLQDTSDISKTVLRRAVLASMLSYLRQTVGSCFATAPCLYILKKCPELYLDDMLMLAKKNCLERISFGKSTSVPSAISVGTHFLETKIQANFFEDSVLLKFLKTKGKLQSFDNNMTMSELLGEKEALEFYTLAHDPLLKIWEYTVASFCDAKGEFTQSTLYLTLGLDSKAPEGLGEFFSNLFQSKLDKKHELYIEAHNEAYLAHQRLVMAEALAKNASTETSLQRAKSEIIAANYQLHSRELDLEDAKKEEEKIKHLYEKKMSILAECVPHVFQESYDPDLVQMKTYSEDAPAGFRLFVKDNRLQSRFQAINTEDEFVAALKLFFEKIEQELLKTNIDKETSHLISNVITETIQFSASKTFLEKTYERARKRHPKALPWAYVSGGTLETLLKTYFKKETLKTHHLSADSQMQFFVELVDYFKALPDKYLEPFRENHYLGLLVETKHHACQIMPGLKFFRRFWESNGFTYSEIRDQILEKGRQFYSKSNLQKIIPEDFFQKMGKAYPQQSCANFLSQHHNFKESFFIVSAFLISNLSKSTQETECGYCVIGDTNWTFNHFIIGYYPKNDCLCFFAQDPVSSGLLLIDTMQSLPIEWKIYEDLTRMELFTEGIKI